MSRERNDRYEVKNGKFGAYFYDKDDNRDMTLEDVLEKLNALGRIMDRGAGR